MAEKNIKKPKYSFEKFYCFREKGENPILWDRDIDMLLDPLNFDVDSIDLSLCDVVFIGLLPKLLKIFSTFWRRLSQMASLKCLFF